MTKLPKSALFCTELVNFFMTLFRFFVLLNLVFLTFFCPSCQKETPKCFKSTGEILLEERITAPFSKIEIYDHLFVEINQDSFYSLSIEAGKNLLPFIKTDFENGILKIQNQNRCDFLRSYKNNILIRISLPNLDEIYYNGTGDITFNNNFKTNRFKFFSLNGSGSLKLNLICDSANFQMETGAMNLEISGKAFYSYFYQSGVGQANCCDFETKICHVNNFGSGDVQVQTDSILIAEIYKSGNIVYQSDPQKIIQVIEGSGKLKKK